MSAGRLASRLAAALLALALFACADLEVADEAYHERDYARAHDHWADLARRGFPEAHYRLAQALAAGHLGSERVVEALVHYERAISLGHPRAAGGLGRFLIRHAGAPGHAAALAALRQAAARGDPPARLALAELMLDGQLPPVDVAGALAVLTEMAEQDHRDAWWRLGRLYEDGVHVARDPVAAARYYRHALDAGSAAAGIRLAGLHERGDGVPRDPDRARELLTELADAGNLSARYHLAGLIERLNPGAEPPPEAMAMYRAAAAAGYRPARLRQARAYLRGEGMPRNVEAAVAILESLSAEGYGPATAQLGDLYRDGDGRPLEYPRAIALYERAIEQGFERAELRLAGLLRRGRGMARDPDAAAAIYRRFAERGDSDAAHGLAGVIEERDGGAIPPPAAIDWYRRAARAGHPEARLRMAELMLEGHGVPRDVGAAIERIERLSSERLGRASLRLGDLYRTGGHRPRDPARALEYYELAVAQGVLEARLRIADIHAGSDPRFRDLARAAEIYAEFAARGDVAAGYKLARTYERRAGADAVDPQIVAWYREAATAGYPPAQIRYADLQLEGIGVNQDVAAATAVFRELSARRIGAATFRLGKLAEFGIGEPVEYQRAAGFYRRSIEEGYDLGRLQLALLTADGRGVERDLPAAVAVLEEFAARRHARAAFELAEIHRRQRTELGPDWAASARRWYRRAIDLGYGEARYALALLLEELDGGISAESMGLLAAASAAGHARSMQTYGVRLFWGHHMKPDPGEGLALTLAAARRQASGALDEAMKLMAAADSAAVIEHANRRSLEILAGLSAARLDFPAALVSAR